MKLGAFSISLAVKDLTASRAFYAHIGFEEAGGDPDNGWLILRNGTTTIGLFQGMFEGNLLTFNPGWDGDAQPLDEFEDVRAIQAKLRDAGIALTQDTDPDGTGPAHISLTDPDGNAILIDQHV
jgi:catechol 2,3-dioxygenase-like lactoylglutathione lyase family enzyme